jgi:precorrin-3B synthase
MMSPSRRNACPTIARPMATGDGLLARLPPTGPLALESIRAVNDAAEHFGNGLVEVTARGSIQIRGLRTATTPAFVEALAGAGIADARPAVLAGPLAGLDAGEICDVRGIVRAVRDALATDGLGARLAPKTSVVVDGGGALHLDAIDADLRLVAVDTFRFHLGLGGSAGTATSIGTVPRERAADAVLTVLALLAEAGPGARGRDLDPATVAAAVGAAPAHLPAPRRPAEPIGIHRLADGDHAVGIGLPFGQVDTATFLALLGAAAECGATAFAPAEGRTLIALGIAPDAAARFRNHAADLGFIVRADDPRRAISACAGAPACAAGLMPARAIAAAIAAAAAPILDGSVAIHVSGCVKGCANPWPASLALFGHEDGAGLVVAGRAGDHGVATVPPADLPAAVARLAATVRAARRAGEPAAVAIARLGPQRLASAFARETTDA